MIIQCEQCQTKFKLDDSKVTDKGVKVRCAKCKHVFTVRKQEPEPEQPFAAGQDETVVFGAPVPPVSAPENTPSFDFADSPVAAPSEPAPAAAPSFDFSEAVDGPADFAVNSFDAPTPAGAADEFSLSSLQEEQGFATAPPPAAAADEMDFGSIDFGGADETMIAPPPAKEAPAAKPEPQGLDFSDDSMFGAVVPPAAEEQENAISFDFPMDDFADSMGAATDSKAAKVSLEGADAPFSLGEIDFGDELTSVAVQQVNPDELKPAQDLFFAPLAEAQKVPEFDLGVETLPHAPQQGEATAPAAAELPPLPIASRRKQSPLFTGLIATVAVVAVAGLGYMGYSNFSESKQAAPAQQAGKITVRSIKAAYVKNKQAGELLVITGEALNQFAEPRAALQVKGMIFDAKGHSMTSKSAYCGNQLTNEQLADMPLDKIEAAMANQFGDSLANMEVAPGKAVPFVVVIPNPPKEGKDYGVEAAGSTVATANKQQ